MNKMNQTGGISDAITSESPMIVPKLSMAERRTLRRKGFSNLLRMGHCAPSVMQTLLDMKRSPDENLVRLTAGLPGGIGNTGFECGGITAPLIFFGLENKRGEEIDGLPSAIYAWHDYLERFEDYNNSLLCKEILGGRRVPLPCIRVVRHAPEIYKQTGFSTNNNSV